MQCIIVRALSAAAALCWFGGIAGTFASAAEEPYPARPIRLVLPSPPGGGIDALARVITPKLSAAMGQQWVVDNRTGASGNVSTEIVAKAAPDGYTVLMTISTTLTVNPLLYRDVPFDVIRDLRPITQVGGAQYVLVINPSLPANSVAELVAYLKARPGQLNYASAGIGGVSHFATELFKARTGTDIVHVPYKGGGPAAAAVVAGEAHILFGSVASSVPLVNAGRLRALAVTGLKRSPSVPNIPTLNESGITGYNVVTWSGTFVPTGTSDAIVNRLRKEIVGAVHLPDVREAMARQGQEVLTSTPAELAALIRQELANNAKIIKQANIKAE